MNIEEGNKFIAEFMGGELVEFIDLSNSNCTAFKMNNSIYPFYSLAYHSSWDWLMPVVEKIEALDDDFIVEVKLLSCRITRISELFSDEPEFYIEYNGQSKMDCVWLAVVEFIELYNEEQCVKVSDITKATTES